MLLENSQRGYYRAGRGSRPVGRQLALSRRLEWRAAQQERAVHELVGAPKAGLRLSFSATPTSLVVASRLDPALLYLVLGAAILLGVIGAVLAAPDRSVLQAGLFAALCSPIGLFLMVSALRLRCCCVIDRTRNELRIREHGYFTVWQRRYPLEEVGCVYLLTTAGAELRVGGPYYLLGVAVPDGLYLLAEGRHGPPLEAVGRELARYLGVPLARRERPALAAGGRRRLLVGVLLYTAPVSVAVALLGTYLPDTSSAWALSTTLTAIILSQIGAILALLYYRQRGGESSAWPPTGAADEGGRLLSLVESDRAP